MIKELKRLYLVLLAVALLVVVISMLPMASIKSYAGAKPVVTIKDTCPPIIDMAEEMTGFDISPPLGYSVANNDGIVDTTKKISFMWLIEDSGGFDIMGDGKIYNMAGAPAVGTRYYALATIIANGSKACEMDLVINGTTYNCVPDASKKSSSTIVDVGILDANGKFSSGSPDPEPDPTPSPSPSSKAEPAEPAKTDLEIREALEMELPVATVTVDMTQFNKADLAVVPGTTYNLSNFVTTAGIVKGINTAVADANKSGSDTATIYSGKPLCFNNAIVKAIQNGKKTVVYYFTYKGHLYSVTVPATVDAAKVLEQAGFAGPLYVGQQLGTTKLVK